MGGTVVAIVDHCFPVYIRGRMVNPEGGLLYTGPGARKVGCATGPVKLGPAALGMLITGCCPRGTGTVGAMAGLAAGARLWLPNVTGPAGCAGVVLKPVTGLVGKENTGCCPSVPVGVGGCCPAPDVAVLVDATGAAIGGAAGLKLLKPPGMLMMGC